MQNIFTLKKRRAFITLLLSVVNEKFTTKVNKLYTNASRNVVIISNRDNSRDEKYIYLQ